MISKKLKILSAIIASFSLVGCTESSNQAKNGSSLLTGEGIPSVNLGNDGDSYIDTSTWYYYTKSNGEWYAQGSIKGEKGDRGETGEAGEDGKDGSSYWIKGNDGQDGEKGDKGDTGDKGEQGEKGETGEKGDKGDDGVSIVSTYIDENGDLIIEYSDGTKTNAGHLAGNQNYTVNYYIGERLIKTEVVETNSRIMAPSEEYTAGYSISSWHYNLGNKDVIWDFDDYRSRVYENLNLYADYTANQYTLSFVDDQRKNEVEDMVVTYNEKVTLPTISSSGYTFLTWNKEDGTPFSSTLWNIASDTTLYASWVNNEYTVTLNPGYGTVTKTMVEVTYDREYLLEEATRENYVFTGWYDSSDKKVSSKATWKKTQDETFKAKYSSVLTTYNFDAGDGKCDTDTMVLQSGSAYELPTPTKEGYTFVGWYLDDTKVEQSGDSWTYSTTGCTLYAKWFSPDAFGSYPQTEVTYLGTINQLNKLAGDVPESDKAGKWNNFDYLDSKTRWYQDVEYNNEKYRGIYFTEYLWGNKVENYNKNTIYWFKWEPIEWMVLKSNTQNIFLFSKKNVDAHSYYGGDHSLTLRAPYDSIDKEYVYGNNYKYSDIRGWLNTYFYNIAFDSEDKEMIVTSLVDNSLESAGYESTIYMCENTYDKIFLLSNKEVEENISDDLSNFRRQPTEYATIMGGGDDYSLRSPDDNIEYFHRKMFGGNTYIQNWQGVCPALNVIF